MNPSYGNLFKNTTQRAAIGRLVKTLGREKLERAIELIEQTNGERYAPTITTPVELENNLGKLIAFVRKEQKSRPLVVEI